MPSGRKPAPVRAAEVSRQALADPRLSAAALRLLAVIERHDPQGAGAFGCTVDQPDLADRAAVDRARLTRRLAECGYLAIERRAGDGRKLTYKVIR